MNKITILTILLVPVFLIATLASCSGSEPTVELVPTTNGSPGPDNNVCDLPYVFEGIFQLGVVNAPPVEVSLSINMPVFTDELMVYKVIRPIVNDSYAAQIAQRFGFSGEPLPSVGERMVYTFLSGDDTLEIGLDGNIAFHKAHASTSVSAIPSPDACIDIARDWLVSMALYPDDVVEIETAPYLEADGQVLATGVMLTLGIEDYALSGVGAYVAVGEGGAIIKATINALNVEPDSMTKLKSAETALNLLKAFLASPNANPPEAKEVLTNWRAFDYLGITNVTLQYHYIQGDYILPKYVFEGEASYKSRSNIERFKGQVDAILR
jgi:hypothetical protein